MNGYMEDEMEGAEKTDQTFLMKIANWLLSKENTGLNIANAKKRQVVAVAKDKTDNPKNFNIGNFLTPAVSTTPVTTPQMPAPNQLNKQQEELIAKMVAEYLAKQQAQSR